MQLNDLHQQLNVELLLVSNREMNQSSGEEERRGIMPNNPYMFNGSRTAPARGKSRSKTNRRRRNRRRTRKNRKNY